MIKTILFDLDGTLIDTEQAAAAAVTASFSDWGIRLEPVDARYVTGRTWNAACDYLFAKYKIPLPADQAMETMISRYRAGLEQELCVIPGAVQAVRSLAGSYELALVSGSWRREILWALEKLGIRDAFQVILGAEDYPRSKPQPDGYLKALDLMKADASRALVFEDSEAGISSGRAAGCWVVAVTVANHFGHDISAAHHRVADLSGVTAKWVAGLNLR